MFQLTVVCGNAAVGKTTYGRRLAEETNALLLDIDTVSERLVQAGLRGMGRDPNDRDSVDYKRIYRDAIHETLFAIARENLQFAPCILVAPFTEERRDPRFPEQLLNRTGCKATIHYLTCSDAERKRRIINRANPRDSAKLENWEGYSQRGRDEQPPPFDHVLVETD